MFGSSQGPRMQNRRFEEEKKEISQKISHDDVVVGPQSSNQSSAGNPFSKQNSLSS